MPGCPGGSTDTLIAIDRSHKIAGNIDHQLQQKERRASRKQRASREKREADGPHGGLRDFPAVNRFLKAQPTEKAEINKRHQVREGIEQRPGARATEVVEDFDPDMAAFRLCESERTEHHQHHGAFGEFKRSRYRVIKKLGANNVGESQNHGQDQSDRTEE